MTDVSHLSPLETHPYRKTDLLGGNSVGGGAKDGTPSVTYPTKELTGRSPKNIPVHEKYKLG